MWMVTCIGWRQEGLWSLLFLSGFKSLIFWAPSWFESLFHSHEAAVFLWAFCFWFFFGIVQTLSPRRQSGDTEGDAPSGGTLPPPPPPRKSQRGPGPGPPLPGLGPGPAPAGMAGAPGSKLKPNWAFWWVNHVSEANSHEQKLHGWCCISCLQKEVPRFKSVCHTHDKLRVWQNVC